MTVSEGESQRAVVEWPASTPQQILRGTWRRHFIESLNTITYNSIMNIMICGSMSFAKQMLDYKKQLEKLGHSVTLADDVEIHATDIAFIDDLSRNLQHLIERDLLRNCFEKVIASDAVLALNFPKNGLQGYIGTSTLMEIAFAYFHRKKIFLLYPLPEAKHARWSHEVMAMQPRCINGNLAIITK
jgi:hypothetical protein